MCGSIEVVSALINQHQDHLFFTTGASAYSDVQMKAVAVVCGRDREVLDFLAKRSACFAACSYTRPERGLAITEDDGVLL